MFFYLFCSLSFRFTHSKKLFVPTVKIHVHYYSVNTSNLDIKKAIPRKTGIAFFYYVKLPATIRPTATDAAKRVTPTATFPSSTFLARLVLGVIINSIIQYATT